MPTTKDYAASLVAWFGVIGFQELSRKIREAGLRAEFGSLENLHEEHEDIVKVENFYVSTDKDSRIGKTLRLLDSLGISNEDDLRGGIRRSLGGSEMVPREQRVEVAAKTLKILSPLHKSWRPLRRNEMAEDRALIEHLTEAPGGVVKRGDLEEWMKEHTRSENDLSVTYSPVLEMVSNGVFGIRGAEVDLAAVEALRNPKPGPWSQWGRLDRQRMWIEVKTAGQEIRVRIPADCREVLEERTWGLTTIAGGQLGTLRVAGERSVLVDWTHEAPSDWTAGEHVAVLEFDTTDSSAKLFPGASMTDDFNHRLVDGCVLVNGRWQFTFLVDEVASSSGSISIPRAVSGLNQIAYREENTFKTDDGSLLTVSREPHACRVSGLETQIRAVDIGSYIRLGFSFERCEVSIAGPSEQPADVLSRYAGLFITPDNLWPSIGKALGESGADRQRIREILADRQRFDLNHILDASVKSGAAIQRVVVPSGAFYVENATLLRHDGEGTFYAERVVGNGLFGLVWNRGGVSTTRDEAWAQRSLLVIHAWSAAANHPDGLLFSRVDDGWKSELGHFPTIRDGLKHLASQEGELPLASIRSPEGPMLPLKSLGYATAFSSAETRLTALRIDAEGWTGFNVDGLECGPSPLLALQG